jgi:hypothetical protein
VSSGAPLTFTLGEQAQGYIMVSTNVLTRVFRIYSGSKTGTAFTIERGQRQYLVSASHIFEGVEIVNEVNIFHENRWKKLPVKVVFNSMEKGDTIVFSLEGDISPRHPVEYGTGNVMLGSWAYFLGFPLGMYTDAGKLNNEFPFPFIKAGLISSIRFDTCINTIYLDGHNNKGFSGGPVVWCHPNKPDNPKIIGVVSGYLNEAVLATETLEDAKVYSSNAGIIEAYWINDVFNLIP